MDYSFPNFIPSKPGSDPFTFVELDSVGISYGADGMKGTTDDVRYDANNDAPITNPIADHQPDQ